MSFWQGYDNMLHENISNVEMICYDHQSASGSLLNHGQGFTGQCFTEDRAIPLWRVSSLHDTDIVQWKLQYAIYSAIIVVAETVWTKLNTKSEWLLLVWFGCLMAYQRFLGYLMPKPLS